MNKTEMIISTNTNVIDINSDTDVEITAEEPVDVVDAVYYTVLKQLLGKHFLTPGKYNIRLMCVVTDNDGT